MRRAFKYRLWTTEADEALLTEMLDTCRHLYNECLGERQKKYQEEGVTLSCRDQQAAFRAIRKEHYWYSRLNAHCGEVVIKRVDLAFQAFFRRVKNGEKPGYPNFKGREWFNCIPYGTYPDGIKLNGDRLYVQHVGDIRVKLHRPVEGEVKTAMLKRAAGKWYVVLSSVLPDCPGMEDERPVLGIDLGLTDFAIGVTEYDPDRIAVKIGNPRFLKTELAELRRKQRAISRKKRGGSNRRKAVGHVTKLHIDLANVRKEWHRKTAVELVAAYPTIVVEKLNVREMLEQRKWSRSIADASWAGFLAALKDRAEKIGAKIIEVDPRGTTQCCSQCNAVVPKEIWQRRHLCPDCGLDIGRDHNAAINILNRGLEIMRNHKPAGTTPQAGRVRTGPTGVVARLKRPGSPRRPIAMEVATTNKASFGEGRPSQLPP